MEQGNSDAVGSALRPHTGLHVGRVTEPGDGETIPLNGVTALAGLGRGPGDGGGDVGVVAEAKRAETVQ